MAKAALEAQQAKVAKSKDWTSEETQNLTKGIVKFPAGTVNRWRVIADFVGSKSQKEVIAKAKELQELQQKMVEEKRLIEQKEKEKLARIKKEAQEQIKQDLIAEKSKAK